MKSKKEIEFLIKNEKNFVKKVLRGLPIITNKRALKRNSKTWNEILRSSRTKVNLYESIIEVPLTNWHNFRVTHDVLLGK